MTSAYEASAQAVPLANPPAAPAAAPAGVTPPPTANAGVTTPGIDFRLAAGDVIEVSVFEHPEFSKVIVVRPDGKFGFPFLNEVTASGVTLSELTEIVKKGLSTEIRDPQVTVSLLKRPERTVSTLGAVKTPGKRPMNDGWRLLDLIVESGGLTVDRPEWATATLVRAGGTRNITVDLARLLTTGSATDNVLLEPGDVLLVQSLDLSRTHVQVTGAVTKPGFLPIPPTGSIDSVIAAAGGATPAAAMAKAAVIRDGKPIPVDLSKTTKEGYTLNAIVLKPGDTLVIPSNQQSFAVFGAVGQPGVHAFPEGETVTISRALSLAGGTSAAVDLKHATLIRKAEGEEKPIATPMNLEDLFRKGDASKDVALKPGDVLFLPSKDGTGGANRFGFRDLFSLVPFVGFFAR